MKLALKILFGVVLGIAAGIALLQLLFWLVEKFA